MMTKTRKYVLIGLLVDIAVPLAASLLLALQAAVWYDGRCISLGIMGGGECTRLEYVVQTVGLIWLVAFMAAVEKWWLVLLALLLAPAVGYFLAQRKSRKVFR
jgi:hypothetical protein